MFDKSNNELNESKAYIFPLLFLYPSEKESKRKHLESAPYLTGRNSDHGPKACICIPDHTVSISVPTMWYFFFFLNEFISSYIMEDKEKRGSGSGILFGIFFSRKTMAL